MQTVNYTSKEINLIKFIQDNLVQLGFHSTILQQIDTDIYIIQTEVKTIDEGFAIGIIIGKSIKDFESQVNIVVLETQRDTIDYESKLFKVVAKDKQSRDYVSDIRMPELENLAFVTAHEKAGRLNLGIDGSEGENYIYTVVDQNYILHEGITDVPY